MQIIFLILAILSNIAIVVLNSYLFVKIRHSGYKISKYFTIISNMLAILISLIFIIFTILCYPILPEWVKGLRFMSSYMLFLTMTVVVLVLEPLKKKKRRSTSVVKIIGIDKTLMDNIFHYIVPIISIVSYVVFERYPVISWPWAIYGAIPTIVYFILYIVFTMFNIWVEPYGLFKKKQQLSIYVIMTIVPVFTNLILWWSSFVFV